MTMVSLRIDVVRYIWCPIKIVW